MEQLALREELACIETSEQAEEALALFSSGLAKTIKVTYRKWKNN